MSGACGVDGSQSSKNSLEAMENIVKQQVAAIGQLDASLSALEKENERLAAEQRAIEASTAKAEAEALRRFVASEFRLAQAHTFLPYKRARHCLSSVSTEATTTMPVSTLDYLHYGGLLSPALSALYRAAIEHAKVTKTKLKQSFDDLTAWKFSPDSPSGKRLMTCMRQLLAKNEGLGRVNEADRLTALESEAAMQATCIEEFLKTNQELESVLEESSFDLEGLQSSLLILKQQLCLAQSLLDDLKREYEVHRPGQADALIEAALTNLSRLQEGLDEGEVPDNEPESLDAIGGGDDDVLVYDKEGGGEDEMTKGDQDGDSKCKTEEDEGTPPPPIFPMEAALRSEAIDKEACLRKLAEEAADAITNCVSDALSCKYSIRLLHNNGVILQLSSERSFF
ncbi:hypothetical protein AAHC03_020675 [Spirometra sp. Aus1]